MEENCPRRPRRAPTPAERQQDADRSRRLLLDAALEEFAAKGYAGARVQEIAARAGVNKQLINYYFDSKEGLYLELQRIWLRRERSFADPELPLAELAVRYLHEALTEPNLTRLMVWRGLTAGTETEGAEGGAARTDGTKRTEGTARTDETEATRRTDETEPTQRTDGTEATRLPGETGETIPNGDVGQDALADLTPLLSRQATGELADDLDPASVRLAIMGAVMVPIVLPQLVRRIFGMTPDDPAFEARYSAHLRAMIKRLGSDREAEGA